jgi:hypothetical protein
MISYDRADAFIRSVGQRDVAPYIKYWATLVPQTSRDIWLRWVFAFMSVRTTWSTNVKGYRAVKALPDGFTRDQLVRAVVDSGAGLHTMRIRGLWEFTQIYKERPDWFFPKPGESMVRCRNRLSNALHGIALAKTSFAFEMLFPLTCGVVCLDTHMVRLYGHTGGTPADKLYHKIEDHWTRTCHKQGVPPALTRHIYWDRLQGFKLNNYWAWCLEPVSAETKGGQYGSRGIPLPGGPQAA